MSFLIWPRNHHSRRGSRISRDLWHGFRVTRHFFAGIFVAMTVIALDRFASFGIPHLESVLALLGIVLLVAAGWTLQRRQRFGAGRTVFCGASFSLATAWALPLFHRLEEALLAAAANAVLYSAITTLGWLAARVFDRLVLLKEHAIPRAKRPKGVQHMRVERHEPKTTQWRWLSILSIGGVLMMSSACATGDALRTSDLVQASAYREVDVSFQNEQDGVVLAGTLALPAGAGRFPAVVLVSGSGPLDRDSTHLGHQPFRIIADNFARRGIAVLRYDKRGIGMSAGDFQTATVDDLAGDAIAAATFLVGRQEILPDHIGAVGHSEGGLVAVLAANRSEQLRFLVLLAAPALPIKDNAALLFALMANESEPNEHRIRQDKERLRAFFEVVTHGTPAQDQAADSIETARHVLSRMTPGSRSAFGLSEVTPELFVTLFSTVPCVTGFLNVDPETHYRRIKRPLLAIYGGKDIQVPAKENIEALRKALRGSSLQGNAIVEVPDVNHLFQHSQTGFPSEYEHAGPTMAPHVLAMMSSWIIERGKAASSARAATDEEI